MRMIRDIWNWIKDHRIGVGIGATFGVGVYLFYSGQGSPLFAVDAPSAVDKVVTIATKWKYLIALTFAGAGVGAIVENLARGK